MWVHVVCGVRVCDVMCDGMSVMCDVVCDVMCVIVCDVCQGSDVECDIGQGGVAVDTNK